MFLRCFIVVVATVVIVMNVVPSAIVSSSWVLRSIKITERKKIREARILYIFFGILQEKREIVCESSENYGISLSTTSGSHDKNAFEQRIHLGPAKRKCWIFVYYSWPNDVWCFLRELFQSFSMRWCCIPRAITSDKRCEIGDAQMKSRKRKKKRRTK